MNECIFCKIINDKERAFLYENDVCVVFESNAPIATHHLLIVPKQHVVSFIELDHKILGLTEMAQEVIKDKKLEGGYKLVFNGGKYQEIQHVHWHLLAGNLEKNDDILSQI